MGRTPSSNTVLRLYLIRHSETEANLAGVVLGQSDSPVTERGMEQARALGRTNFIRETRFQRYYTSDIHRAVQTTHLVLEAASRGDPMIRLEPRLREMAKGAREGQPKSVSDEEALLWRRRQNKDVELPLRETEDEAWNRIHAFLQDLLEDYASQSTTSGEPSDGRSSQSTDPCCIFVMSHSAILRIFLRRLIGDEHLYQHPSARFDATGHLYIPNTSVTILDVRGRDEQEPPHNSASTPHTFHVDIIQLTCADHLGETNSQAAYAE
uniref:Phosphoglycerate mutase (2,3-diphosphoglycerate-dependent) n=1 Tax=Amphora coffeiformis TaxID=265554 RepID=A0A7S3L2T4_9STRA|mmetsp:Transcript_15773/g.30056  ORF Transcript_15773/g.30056 Transcript_15773/m.30056 type:complete len:267 (-) Transcript_15773:52-852(-)|eukprot:scaffold34627_cov159-Amphora_coffeaeformis.AAC.1